jgi:hypothetical protein
MKDDNHQIAWDNSLPILTIQWNIHIGGYLLTQAGFLRAFRRPGFFLSTRRASNVTHPAENLLASSQYTINNSTYLDGVLASELVHEPVALWQQPV